MDIYQLIESDGGRAFTELVTESWSLLRSTLKSKTSFWEETTIKVWNNGEVAYEIIIHAYKENKRVSDETLCKARDEAIVMLEAHRSKVINIQELGGETILHHAKVTSRKDR